jgi:mono/diheme cytochrome c family protein
VGVGCASTQSPAQTIEPPAPSTSEPAARAEADGRDGDSTRFVLSREPVTSGTQAAEDAIHINDRWWRFRANFLKMSDGQARERDGQIPTRQAPAEFWDPQTALETVVIWTTLCNQCHGGRRRQQDALSMPAPPPNWGQGEGLFFGNRRSYAEVFATVYNGGPKRGEGKAAMPAWRGILAREEIWALLYFLEYQSGGIEGRFPPSLYPRMRTDVGGQ